MSLPRHFHKATRTTQRAVDAFNKAHPVGTAVIVTFHSGRERTTKTRSRAFALGDDVVVQIEGLVSCYPISSVRKAAEVPA